MGKQRDVVRSDVTSSPPIAQQSSSLSSSSCALGGGCVNPMVMYACQRWGLKFADDSYGAYRNRGSRQVGTYKRSSSAALLRPDNQHLKNATDAQAVFGDGRLGNQAWNSDTQLQATRKVEVQGAPPQRPPDRAGNRIPADGLPARSVGRVSGIAQPSSSSVQGQLPGGRARDEGKVFTAHPFCVEQALTIPEKEVINSYDAVQSSRLVSAEKTVSPSSSSSSLSPATSPLHTSTISNSSGQRWANALPFPTTHRVTGDEVKPPPVNAMPGSPHTHRASHTRSVVLTVTDSQQPRDRLSGPIPTSTTHNTPTTRSRILSDRTRHGDISPSADSKQRFAEVAPFASDPRNLPGHVRTYSQSSEPPPRSTPSPYNRRESAPVSHIPPEAIAMVSPRRKSQDLLLSDTEKEPSLPTEQVPISHGRQPSQEELECDQQAKELAKEVADSEKKLSDVLNADGSKKRMEYINGIFSEPVEVKIQTSARMCHHSLSTGEMPLSKSPQHSPSHSIDEDQLKKRTSVPLKPWTSSTHGAVEKMEEPISESTSNALDSETLVKRKEEVMEKLQKKQELLKEEKKGLQEEIDGNKALGKCVCDTVDNKCSNPSERDKFHTYVNDVEKIVRLLLNLSGQLARAENAVQAMGDGADPEQKKRAQEKCEGLRTKYAEAKQLKEHIDKRSDNVSAILRQSLSVEELKDYSQFIGSTSRLTIHLQQVEDEISLNCEQIQELKKSMAEWAAAQKSLTSSLPSSSSPVPVSS